MNENITAEQWKQMRNDVKAWWGNIDDHELDRVNGRKDELVELVKQKYGYAHDFAMQEVDRRMKEFSEKAGGAVSSMSAKVQEFGTSAARKANDAAAATGEKLGSLAGAIRGSAPSEGKVATAAATVADGLDSAGHYLREKKFDHLGRDLTSLVRTYPIHAVVIGIGVGYLLARRSR
jgi:uncharacterized protein YjbJ (UPF0337 family)